MLVGSEQSPNSSHSLVGFYVGSTNAAVNGTCVTTDIVSGTSVAKEIVSDVSATCTGPGSSTCNSTSTCSDARITNVVSDFESIEQRESVQVVTRHDECIGLKVGRKPEFHKTGCCEP